MLPELPAQPPAMPERVALPPSLLNGCRITETTGPAKVVLNHSLPRHVFVAGGQGGLEAMPAAEGSVALLKAGFPAPEPMTLCLTIFSLSDGRRVFICTELASNRGVSVTNAWPELAGVILRHFGNGVPPESAVFIEHYFPGSYRSGERDETYDLVAIQWKDARPAGQIWRRIR